MAAKKAKKDMRGGFLAMTRRIAVSASSKKSVKVSGYTRAGYRAHTRRPATKKK